MKEAGVDIDHRLPRPQRHEDLAQELQRQGIRDKVTMIHANTYDQKFVDEANGALRRRPRSGVAFRPFEADAGDSELTQFKEWMEKQDKPITEIAMNGWINADARH